ncbi:MAG: DUF1800 family protein [Anaerolineae bacterium]
MKNYLIHPPKLSRPFIFGTTVFLLSILLTGTGNSLFAQVTEQNRIFLPLVINGAATVDATNLALEKTASLSSAAYNSEPNHAVDGDTNGDFSNNSVAVTDTEQEPWWQVDLGDVYKLDKVGVWGRTDCCKAEFNNFYVFVSDNDFGNKSLSQLLADTSVWRTLVDGNSAVSLNVAADTTGRYVRIQMVGEKSLALAEVKVYGSPILNGTPILQVGRESVDARAIEGTDETAVYTVRRYGNTAAISIPFQVNQTTQADLQAETDEWLKTNNQPDSAFFFPNNVTVCTIPGVSADVSPAAGTASSGDYILKDEDGKIITNALDFKAGEVTKKIIVSGLEDDQLEVPEKIEIELSSTSGYDVNYTNPIEVFIADGQNEVGDDSQLFVATMRAEGTAQTSATGIATVRLAEDNSFAAVSMSFSGLTSEQTAAHIHVGNPGPGPIVFSLPMGQFTNLQWGIKAAQFIQTDQEMLDALLAGELYTNVHSAKYPAGEIKGYLTPSSGTSEPNLDYPTPEIETLTGEALTQDIVRFLRQSTFGPTPELVADLESRIAAENGDRMVAYAKWIDEQMLLESPSHLEYFVAARKQYLSDVIDLSSINSAEDVSTAERNILLKGEGRHAPFYGAWFTSSVYAKAQLRERTAFALSEIFVVSMTDSALNQKNYGVAAYNDMLKENAFGNYESLLTDVAKHPTMGTYLSHLKNQKDQYDDDGNLIASPDENFAREVMQLFSIGLIARHPDYSIQIGSNGLPLQTYDQSDITELARVFTGWSYGVTALNDGYQPGSVPNTEFNDRGVDRAAIYHPYMAEPMTVFLDNGYEPDNRRYVKVRDEGEKTILGATFPAGQTGEQDLAQIMGILSTHPNTAPFISYRLIQRFVTSNPSAGYVYRVSSKFTETNGNLGETIKAILLDPEARNLAKAEEIGSGRVQEPLIRMMGMFRLMNAEYANEAEFPISGLVAHGLPANELNLYEADAKRLFLNQSQVGSNSSSFGQAPLTAPNVFNWFMPDFAPAGPVAAAGNVTPEMGHMNESTVINFYNSINAFVFANGVNKGSTGYPAKYQGDKPRPLFVDPQIGLDAYMSVMDTNNDNTISELDTSFDDDLAVREATAAVIDAYDLLICDGWLNARATGNGATDPREIIIEGISGTHASDDGKTEERAIKARDNRLREIVLVLFTAPQCVVQK